MSVIEGREALHKALEHLPSASVVGLLLDIDNLKGINASAGHEVGNSVVEAVANTTAKLELRYEAARVFQHGGDEFAVLRPNYSLDEGVALARAIASATRELRLSH